MECKNCGANFESKHCPYCGTAAPQQQSSNQSYSKKETYSNISYTVTINSTDHTPADFVSPVQAAPAASLGTVPISTKSRGVACLLCFFLGIFGVHRFYVGKIGTGVLYLLTMGLFMFGAFVDLFIIAFGLFKDKDGAVLKR